MNKTNDLGKAIRRVRQELNLSQKEFAKAFGIGQQAICTWENNGRVPEKHWPKLMENYNINAQQYADMQHNIGNKHSNIVQDGEINVKNNFSNEEEELLPGELFLIQLIRRKQDPTKLLDELISMVLARD